MIESAPGVLARNGILLTALLPACFTPSRRTDRVCASGSHNEPSVHAFTLIETLVVIALVSVLLALLLPSLRPVRDAAREARVMSDLRSHAMVFSSYTSDSKGLFPNLADPKATSSVIRSSTGPSVEILYFDQDLFWNIGLADDYYQSAWNSASFRSPFSTTKGPGGTDYLSSCTLVASPEFYDSKTRRTPPAQLRGVRESEVLYPAAKGLLVARWPNAWYFRSYRGHGRAFGAMADGHATGFTFEDLVPQHRSGDGVWPQYGAHFPTEEPLLHTEHGVRGRDLR